MNKYILKNIYRPSEDTLKDYRKYDVSTVYEAQDKTGLMLPYMRPLIEGQQIRRACGDSHLSTRG